MPADASRERAWRAVSSLDWAEELTWMEIRDLVRAGTTTIIIATGEVEQNGPYVVGGKHNVVLQSQLSLLLDARRRWFGCESDQKG